MTTDCGVKSKNESMIFRSDEDAMLCCYLSRRQSHREQKSEVLRLELATDPREAFTHSE